MTTTTTTTTKTTSTTTQLADVRLLSCLKEAKVNTALNLHKQTEA